MTVAVAVGFEPVDDRLAAAWDELADGAGAAPFLRPGWALAWAAAFAPSRPLHAVVVRRGGRPVAVLPVRRRAGVLASPANWHTPWSGAVADGAGALDALARHVAATSAHTVSLRFLRADGHDTAALDAAARAAGRAVARRTMARSPHVELDGGWDGYAPRLGAKVRAELRRRRRRLDELGEVAVEVVDGTVGLDRHLGELLAVEASGWKGSAGTAMASQPATERFYRAVARWAADRGTLRLAFLRVGGRAVAADLALEDGGRHHLLKTGYDPAMARYAPGLVLREAMVRRAFDLSLRSYELLGSEAPWKAVWATGAREVVALHAFSPSPAGRASRVAQVAGRPVAVRALVAARRLTRR